MPGPDAEQQRLVPDADARVAHAEAERRLQHFDDQGALVDGGDAADAAAAVAVQHLDAGVEAELGLALEKEQRSLDALHAMLEQ